MAAGLRGDPTLLRALSRLGPGLLAEAVWSVLLARPRSVAEDAVRAVARLDRPWRVEGSHHVPPADPFALVANHYQTPDLWVGWVAAAITAAVAGEREAGARDLHWMVLSEWGLEIRGHWVPHPITSLLFPRAARVWGLIPTPSRPSDVAGRARGLRKVLAYLGRRPSQERRPEPVALFPEGQASVALREAMPGTGAFLHRITGLGVPMLPVGVHQDANTLVVRFGSPFLLGGPPPGPRESLDSWARTRLMVAIGQLLPREMWGAYEGQLSRTDG